MRKTLKRGIAWGLSLALIANSSLVAFADTSQSAASEEFVLASLQEESVETESEQSEETVSEEKETEETVSETAAQTQETEEIETEEKSGEEVGETEALPTEETGGEVSTEISEEVPTEETGEEVPTEISEEETISSEETVEETETDSSEDAESDNSSEEVSEEESESTEQFEEESESTEQLETAVEEETQGYLADALVEGDFQYTVSGSNATITGYQGDGGEVTIPAAIGDYTVTAIGSSAFASSAVTSVVILDSVTSIGDSAFKNCSQLASVTLSQKLTSIGTYTFDGCGQLGSLELPASLTSIGVDTFYGSGLTSITIPSTVTKIGEAAFQSCKSLKEVKFEAGNKYRKFEMGEKVFFECTNLTTINLPEDLKSIPAYTFSECSSLTNLGLPESLTSIGEYAFSGNGLTSVTIPSKVTEVGGYAFANNNSLLHVTFQDGDEYRETRIGSGVFSGCKKLETLILPNSLKEIGSSAFKGCEWLTSVELPDKVTSVENSAFSGCERLVNLTLSAELTSIGGHAFDGCSLTNVTIPGKVKTVGYYAFANNSSLLKVEFLKGDKYRETTIGDYAFYECSKMKTLTLPESLKSIGGYAFYDCKRLESLKIPDKVTSIGDDCFYNCVRLQDLTLSKDLVSIGSYAFWGGGMSSVTIANKVETVGAYAFADTKVTKVTFQSGSSRYTKMTIGVGAFSNCERLVDVTLPAESITEIGKRAFKNCKWLVNLKFTSSKLTNQADIKANAFSGCERLAALELPENIVTIGDNAFSGCKGLVSVELPDTVTSIGNQVFSDCEQLLRLRLSENLTKMGYEIISGTHITSLIIPKNVESVDVKNVRIPAGSYGNAYYNRYYGPVNGAAYLEEVIFEEGTKAIPDYMCAGNKSIKRVIIPESVSSIGSYLFKTYYNEGIDREKLAIYGVAGSYAEGYARKYNIPFNNAGESNPDIYKNAEYTVKIIDSASSKVVKGAAITINGEQVGVSGADGIVNFSAYATVSQSVRVQKDGYKIKYYTAMPWSSTSQNVVELEATDGLGEELLDVLPEIKLEKSTLYGPQITIFGETFYLFEMEIGLDIPYFENASVSYDAETQTAKILIGFSDEAEAELNGSEGDDSYWEESYQEVKNLVKACGAKNVDESRLWSQFSKLKDKLQTVEATTAFSASGSITGFIELKHTEDGWKHVDGGLVTNLTASASTKMPLCYILYAEFGLTGSVDGKLNFTLDNQKGFDINGSVGLSLKPSVALGANALIVDVKGGLEGDLTGTFSFPANSMQEAFLVTLSGEIYIKANSPVPFFCAEKTWNLGKVELYPDFGACLEVGDWNLAIEDRVVPGEGQVYEYADTQTVTLSDGRSVMVYIDDDGTKTTGNHTTLMYSVYSNGTWSEAKPVCETGRADASPVLRSDGEKAYVVWLNIGKEISADSSADEIYQNSEIWFSEWNGEAFSTPERIPNAGNKKIEFSYDLCVSDGTVAVTWIENTENDPFMQSGKNEIYSRIRKDGTWQNVSRMLSTYDMIGALQASLDADTVSVQYSDGTKLFRVSDNNSTDLGNGSNIKIFDGVVYYLKDNQLYSFAADGTETAYAVYCSDDYQIYNGTAYWTQQSEYKSELYMQKLGKEQTVQLTHDGGYIDNFSLCKLEDGTINVTYTWTKINEGDTSSPYGATYIKTVEGETVYDLACDGLYFDESEMVVGRTASFGVMVQNQSTDTIKNIKLRVKGRNSVVVYSGLVLDELAPGEKQKVTFEYKLPSNLSGLKLNAEIYSDDIEEADYSNNTCTTTFEDTDLKIKTADKDSVTIVNQGYTAAKSVVVEVREGGSRGTVVSTIEVGNLGTGKSAKVDLQIPEEYLKFQNAESEKMFYIAVTSSTPEALMSDNYETVTIEPEHITGISLDKTELNMEAGQTEKLTMTLLGNNGATSTVSWRSSNTDVVKVDSEGNVTAIAAGEANVSVIASDGGYVKTCHIVVIEILRLNSLILSSTESQMKAGEQMTLTYTAEPALKEGQEEEAVWTSSDETVATVQNGVVTAVGVGNAEITLTLGGLTAVCKVETYPSTLTLSETEHQMKVREQVTLTYTTDPTLSEAQAQSAVWTSSDEAVATVSGGVVHAVGAGNAEITLTVAGLTATCKVEVEEEKEETPFAITEITSTAYNKLKISWSQVDGADGYTVYRLDESTGKFAALKTISDGATLSYINSVTCGVTYTYRVAAYTLENDKKVYQAQTEAVSAKASLAAPNFQSANIAAYNKIRLIWDKVNGSEGYVIYRSDSEDGKYSVLKTVTQASATNYVNVVKESKEYYYKVRAFVTIDGKKVYGEYSDIKSGSVLSGAPQNISLTQTTSSKATFTWDKVEDAAGYVIYQYNPETKRYKAIKGINSADILSYSKKMVANPQTQYAMRAYRVVNGVKIYGNYSELICVK